MHRSWTLIRAAALGLLLVFSVGAALRAETKTIARSNLSSNSCVT